MTDLLESLSNQFAAGRFSEVINRALSSSVSPGTAPNESKILAASYFRLGDFEKARSILIELEAIFSESPDYLSLYAATSRRLGLLDDADKLFKRALQIVPKSTQIRNNYANLLIDLERYDEAMNLLDNVLIDQPSYQDALSNRNRLILLQEQKKQSSSSAANIKNGLESTFLDPLLMSFDQEEIDFSNSRYFAQSNTNKQMKTLAKPSERSVALDQLSFAEASILAGDSNTVLKICTQVSKVLGQDARIYDIASDAYLNLNQISQAEICLLHSLAIGGITPKRCCNLASFSMIRKNFDLAEHYLSQAASIDPSSEHVSKIKALLSKQKSSAQPFIFSEIWSSHDALKV